MGKKKGPLGTYRGELWFCECVSTGVKEILQEKTFTWRTEERRSARDANKGERYRSSSENGLFKHLMSTGLGVGQLAVCIVPRMVSKRRKL